MAPRSVDLRKYKRGTASMLSRGGLAG